MWEWRCIEQLCRLLDAAGRDRSSPLMAHAGWNGYPSVCRGSSAALLRRRRLWKQIDQAMNNFFILNESRGNRRS